MRGSIAQFSRVIDGEICYFKKDVGNLYDLFRWRADMHRKVYTHKKVRRRCSTRSSAAV